MPAFCRPSFMNRRAVQPLFEWAGNRPFGVVRSYEPAAAKLTFKPVTSQKSTWLCLRSRPPGWPAPQSRRGRPAPGLVVGHLAFAADEGLVGQEDQEVRLEPLQIRPPGAPPREPAGAGCAARPPGTAAPAATSATAVSMGQAAGARSAVTRSRRACGRQINPCAKSRRHRGAARNGARWQVGWQTGQPSRCAKGLHARVARAVEKTDSPP
jgi:hypothetical protein